MIHNLLCKSLENSIWKKVMPNGIGRCMSFSLGNGLVFMDSLDYLNVSLDNLVKPLEKNNCYHLRQ